MNWLDKKEEAVIMVILPPCYYCLYCMRSRCENSSVKTESVIVILFCCGLTEVSVVYTALSATFLNED